MIVPVLKRASLWLPPIVYMAVIFHLSAESNPLPEVTTQVWDKLLHAIEYAGLAVLLCRALLGEGLGWLAATGIAAIATSAYGASDEMHQLFTPGRDSNIFDWVADSTGAIVGAGSYLLVTLIKHEGRRPRRHEARTSDFSSS